MVDQCRDGCCPFKRDAILQLFQNVTYLELTDTVMKLSSLEQTFHQEWILLLDKVGEGGVGA